MRLGRRVSVLITILGAGMSLIVSSAMAQTNRGGIRGTVTDSNGRVIQRADVTITNVGTNEVYHLKSSGDGTYSLQNLDPVVYRIEVEAPGFQKAELDNIKVNTASIATADVSLRPGTATQTVKVTAEAPLLNEENGTLGTTISERMLTDLPLQNRSVLDLAVTAPNVSGDVGTEDPSTQFSVPVPGFNLSLNGGRPGTSEMLADGVSNTGVGLAREVVAFSPETVQELNVQTSAFSAQYGSTGGGIISVTTKSGTNQYHGAASWYNRNPMFNANPWAGQALKNLPKNNIRWNQASFDLGGPVWIPHLYNGHDKTFFFFAFEPRWQSDKSQVVALVPTDAMRQGNFAGLDDLTNGFAPTGIAAGLGVPASLINLNSTTIYQQYNLVNGQGCESGNPCQLQPLPTPGSGQTYTPFPGNTIPSVMIDPVAQKLLAYMPAGPATPTSCSPTSCGGYFLDSNGLVENYAAYARINDDHRRYMARVDEVLSQKDRLSFRFTDVPEVGSRWIGDIPANGNVAYYSSSRQYMGSYTRTITPMIYNDLRLNYTSGRFDQGFTSQYDIASGQNISTASGLPSMTHGGLAEFDFPDSGNGGTFSTGSANSQLNANHEKQYQIADNLYITHGNMTWTTGVLLSYDALDTENLFAAAGGKYEFREFETNATGSTGERADGSDFASYLLGIPFSITLKDSVIPYHYRWQDAAAFVQDDWKVRPNLTLNLGLRYSWQGPRVEANNWQGIFLPQKAQAFPLQTPITYTYGTASYTLSSVNVPPFSFDGVAGHDAHLTPVNWRDIEPRIGFAYSPHWLGMREWVLRGGYGISHLPYTGQNRQPNPDFSNSALAYGFNSGQKYPTNDNACCTGNSLVMRLSSNPPYDPPLTPTEVIAEPSSGLVWQQSIDDPGFALAANTKTPYVQNWDVSVEHQLGSNMMFEAAYAGSKGTHLFFPAININPYNPTWVQEMLANGANPATTRVPDPLGRTGPPSCTPSSSGPQCKPGAVLQIDAGTLTSNFVGFDGFLSDYDAGADSIRHSLFVNVMSHANHGLTMLANYTFSKSIDDASTAAPDKNVLTSSNLPGGQITYGGTPRGDRSLSTFDVPQDVNLSLIYDIPVGRGRSLLTNAPAIVDETIGGWTVSGVERFFSGFPVLATEATTYLAPNTYATHDIRPDVCTPSLVSITGCQMNVPLKNPHFDSRCVASILCAPYVNPAAFMETPSGGLGTAPRTLSLHGPWQQNLDLSIQKNFRISEKFRLQFRADAINVLNHPLFRTPYGNGGGAGSAGLDLFGGEPGDGLTTPLTVNHYNSWATFNGQPTCGNKTCTGADPGSVQYQSIVAMVNAQRVGANGQPSPTGVLPPYFFTVPIGSDFPSINANQFDIRTLNGYKLYMIRNNYNTSESGAPGFGQLYYTNNERYLQFALRLFF